MLSWLLKRWSWKSFAAGAGAAVFGGTIARPALVTAVKAGMDIQDRAAETFRQAQAGAARIRDEAASLRASGGTSSGHAELLSELKSLREEISALKSNYASRN